MGVNDESGSLSPLPAEYRRGQTAMFITGTISLVSSLCLFVHITYRLVALWLNERRTKRYEQENSVDLSLGLSESHYVQTKIGRPSRRSPSQTTIDIGGGNMALSASNPKAPNPLLILIYNLILADVGFSAAYMANMVWLTQDAVIVGSPTCNFQGWLVSFGCLISSGFLVTLASYTYFIVIRGWRATSRLTVIHCIVLWAVAIFLASLGLMFPHEEHYFARQQFWCWIYGSNAGWRLSVYIWGFTCISATFVVYLHTFWSLHKSQQSSRLMPRYSRSASTSSTSARSHNSIGNNKGSALRPSGHHPAFLIYPLIYMFCATPMTLGSITPLEKSTPFMTFAGVMLSSTGAFNSILWATTIIFSGKDDMVNTGLDQFAFVRTPEDRTFGNMIWVQGAVFKRQSDVPTNTGGWWMLSRGRNNSEGEVPLHIAKKPFTTTYNQQGAIQMDISATVVIENQQAVDKRLTHVTEVTEHY